MGKWIPARTLWIPPPIPRYWWGIAYPHAPYGFPHQYLGIGAEADKQARVGREEEGTSSNRPELGGVVLALRQAELSEDV